MNGKERIPSIYIYHTLEELCLNGDAYTSEEELYSACKHQRPRLSYDSFRLDLAEQVRLGFLHREGRRIYTTKTWRYEESAAKCLGKILQNNSLLHAPIPEELISNGINLCKEQCAAVGLAMDHRLSVILGGAGCGKTTIIRAILEQAGRPYYRVLAAPTGKAARNLQNRVRSEARTIHSALGMMPDDDFLSPVIWECTHLVIIDEASMMTLEMLAGILCKVPPLCRIVLLGDPNQLLSVGAGNVLPDLLALGVPWVCLKCNHRQAENSAGLLRNVTAFSDLTCSTELSFDSSFQLHEMAEDVADKKLAVEAAHRYATGESVQVLAPTRRAVAQLNQDIRLLVNPMTKDKKTVSGINTILFRDGDRVMITKNDRDRNCSNGDVGILHVFQEDDDYPRYWVELPDGRCPAWIGKEGLNEMTLAYALTVHKSQGSEYDTAMMLLPGSSHCMMYRNLLYTAISRGREQVLLYGSRQALSVGIQKILPPRKSMLVTKTRMVLTTCA